MESRARQGYLILADISGFTSFLATTELEHADEILAELLDIIAGHLIPALMLVEVEGDAVYVHAPRDRLTRPETIVELIEATYTAFRDHVDAIRRRTTCTCRACIAIPTLDLKFIVHYGSYVIQTIAGTTKPMGSDVNLVHRLSKNHVTEATGWRGYALFCEPAFAQLGLAPDGFYVSAETYEHLGAVKVYVLNLAERYTQRVEARRVFVSPEQAHGRLDYDLPAPPPVVWDWLNDPYKRAQWEHLDIRPQGAGERTGAGSRNHCMHGEEAPTIQTILDWRPFDYFTYDVRPNSSPDPLLVETYRLEPTATGTHLTVLFQMLGDMPESMKRQTAMMLLEMYKIKEGHDNLPRLIAAEAASEGAETETPAPSAAPASPPAG